MFNPQPRIEAVTIAGTSRCWVIDDALREPERWVELAAQHAGEFAMAPHNAYPGVELRMPNGITVELARYFALHLATRFGAGALVRGHSRLSMVTLQPEQLAPRQWICHRDRLDAPSDHCVAASVLYLFRDAALGGTNFFQPRRPEAETARLVHDSGSADGDAFAHRYGIARAYLTESNTWFEKVLSIAPRWNRLIFYDGTVFHCSDIPDPSRLSTDVRRGRLTFNGFLTCRRV